ncbi:SH2 domain-containing protein [Tellurirhabdus bombi]|uniref:hypothetical protein n=1 Tax=Tellurirhabdus bombi TaxID=2907205 RepID=UPI001F1D9B94|nr:hypothetical protein [Tellurirhabdus bombi]
MKSFFFIAIFSCLFTVTQAQSTDTLSIDSLLIRNNPEYANLKKPGTRYVALDKAGPLSPYRRYRYFPGQTIKFRYDGRRYRERISVVTDTSFALVLENSNNFLPETVHFRLDGVERVYTYRRLPWVTLGAVMLPLAGVVFMGADIVNSRQINTRALVPTGVLIGLGGVCYKASFISIPINRNNRLKVLKTY